MIKKLAWLRKEVPEGRLPYRFWVKLAEKFNKDFKHFGLSVTNGQLAVY